jgi:membrane-bound metal-dependent hydrolase YbcI (DUF457 family)
MPLAVTHILLTIIVVDLYRDYITKHKKLFTLHTLFIAGFAGLLPDIDVPLKMFGEFFNFQIPTLLQHGGITHTLIFSLIFIIPGLILWKKEKHKAAVVFFVISFGVFFHLFLDWLLGGGAYEGIMWFWPFSTATFKLHLLKLINITDLPIALDAIILLGWLWHEERKHKISDFI